ncbi:3'-5' exoribonuclease [Pelomonas sp. KK5]|uniref:3'-5' exoribonuclease n=1 Tax=Pelomonas sp. KK5 TaxID=1855730 RepID=UPI00097BECEA|nr:3'-5' exoribonuclease [Pelomonas sp. KK5]
MIRLFADTEFTDLLDCELLSVGVVSDDGREFYMERTDVDLDRCGDFARIAVVPQLGTASASRGTEAEISRALRAWLAQFAAEAPVIVSVDHPTDWELIVYLIRDEESLVKPAWVKGESIRSVLDPRRIEDYWVRYGRRSHHALHDARANRFAFLHDADASEKSAGRGSSGDDTGGGKHGCGL